MTITDLAPVVRNLSQDFLQNQTPGDMYTFTSSYTFTISEPNAQAITGVYRNDSLVALANYAYNQTTQKLTITGLTFNAGDNIEIQYSFYPNYSNTEIEAYVRSAIVYLSVNNYYTFEVDDTDTFFPEVSEREKNLIALIASILIRPDNQNIRLPDISIVNAASIPTRDIVAKVIRMFKHDNAGMFDIINPYYPPYWMRIH